MSASEFAAPREWHPSHVFRSFWMGGFEGADHVNGEGRALDMGAANHHLEQVRFDHARAAALGIRTVRESVGWRITEPLRGNFEFARLRRIASSAREQGLQVLWTLMHYGTPPDVDLRDDAMIPRFAAFARAVARVVGEIGSAPYPPIYNLVNEISFQSWAVADTNLMHPYRGDPGAGAQRTAVCGFAVKCRLVRATLAAMAAIRADDPSARFLQVEPVIHIVAPDGRAELQAQADALAEHQWQTWDMLAGRLEPGLGGHEGALDLIGVNHYHAGQWEATTHAPLDWHRRDPRRRRFCHQLCDVWQRYRRPLIVAETSHVGEGRAMWLNDIADEVAQARAAGVPVDGICLYPLVDRPDWTHLADWHHSGLWDVDHRGAGPPALPMRRVLNSHYAAALRRWQQHLPHRLSQGTSMQTLIVFSHLRWSFVYQRPQHLMSRLADQYRVIFIEEPVHTDGPARLDRIAHGPSLEVLVPHTPIKAGGFHDDQLPLLEAMLTAHLHEARIAAPIVWLYTPMALPLLNFMRPRAVIFDCMDELTAFRHAPQQLRQREHALLQRADLVLTGGPALYQAKRNANPNVHCLPSSVDAAHYAAANLDAGSAQAADARAIQQAIAGPRLGFFGVIDERFDIELLRDIAQARPDWHFVMVGPVVKIDAADLPRPANIHWLGMQPYERLPYLMADWDVCLMPFALNESTQFISPTKTLEYLAGGKPVVSTPVGDVIALYGDSVRIADGSAEFVAACEAVLAEDEAARTRRQAMAAATVARSSWDRSAAAVHGLIEAALQRTEISDSAFAIERDSTLTPGADFTIASELELPAAMRNDSGRFAAQSSTAGD